MAQIIDIEERRKPRLGPHGGVGPSPELSSLDPLAYIDQLAKPAAVMWRSWFATWGTLWLAPFGLQVGPIEVRPPIEPKDRAGPHG